MMSYQQVTNHTPEVDGDVWHVQLASGDICLMTLDQLDNAFQTSVINENTYLWQEGAAGWVTLREIAGLDVEDEAPPASSAPRYDYAAQDIFAPPPQAIGLNSTAPVVSAPRDMEFDLEPISFRPKKRSGARWLIAAALIGGAGFGAVKSGLVKVPELSAPAATAAAASPVPQADIAPPPTAPSPPSAATLSPIGTSDPARDKALSDDVKQRLANADKALAQKQKQKQEMLQQRRSAAPRSSRSRTSSGEKVFHKGGETGDPLNAAL